MINSYSLTIKLISHCTSSLPLGSELDSSRDEWETDAGDRVYVPTPERYIKGKVRSISLPQTICFLQLSQLEAFVESINNVRMCKTPGCSGNLCPIHVKMAGLGGAINISYACNGCASKCVSLKLLPNTCIPGLARLASVCKLRLFYQGALTVHTIKPYSMP